MKTMYFDLGMGAAGDMITAALLELVENKETFVKKLNSIGLDDVHFDAETIQKCGINGTHMKVTVNGEEEGSVDHHDHEHHHDHEESHEHHHNHHDEHHHNHHDEHHHEHHEHTHHHASLHDIEHIVNGHLNVSQRVKEDVMAVYKLIAEAESVAHGKPVTEIHFHEVGTKDAIADITAVCMLMEEIGPDKVIASPVHVGSGHVHCAHGVLPVPAPATAFILKDIPIYGGTIKGELCTPTGAALLKHFVSEFGEMPVMKVSGIGYGMGKKDFEIANCVRVMVGETEAESDDIIQLSCNVDDMTGEKIGFAVEALFENGALDVYTVPVYMKKSRPGNVINVICKEGNKNKIIETIFANTSTIGIRESKLHRYVLNRQIETVDTEYGIIHKKTSSGYGVKREKYEYDDIAKIAHDNNMSIYEVEKRLK